MHSHISQSKRISRFYVEPSWQEVFLSLGINPGEFLRDSGYPPDFFLNESHSFSVDEFLALWERFMALDSEGDFILRIANNLSPQSLPKVVYSSLFSSDLVSAMQMLSLYKRAIRPVEMSVCADNISLDVVLKGEGFELPRTYALLEILAVLNIARFATGYDIVPKQVSLAGPIENRRGFEEHLGIPIKICDKNEIVFHHMDAIREFKTANHLMWEWVEPELQQLLSNRSNESLGSYSEKVSMVLSKTLPNGDMTIESVAARLGLTKRTLQRNLTNECTSFSELVATTRHALAKYYLTETNKTCHKIALNLCFGNANSFTRAFRRWEGMSPNDYRSKPRSK